MKNNGTICKKCNSDNLECKSQHSDGDGKIVTKWVCLDCKEKFKTKW